MKTIALIGAGQLGSRHLQSLARIEMPVSLEVVEPDNNASMTAKNRFLEIPTNENICDIKFFPELEHLSKKIDLAIVATSADKRYDLVKKLISTKTVSYMILEKIVFQSKEQFEKVEFMLKQRNIACWVNCTRRMFPIYNQIKEIIAEDNKINLQISGGDWGLACNAIHFIDLLVFLSHDTSYQLDIADLDPKVWQSKRKGFVEVTGKIAGRFSNGSRIELESIAGTEESPWISINNSQTKIVLREGNGVATISKRENNWNEEMLAFKIPFQSELTHLAAKEILEYGTCKLTGFNESSLLHKPFLEAIKKHIETVEHRKYDYCPIT